MAGGVVLTCQTIREFLMFGRYVTVLWWYLLSIYVIFGYTMIWQLSLLKEGMWYYQCGFLWQTQDLRRSAPSRRAEGYLWSGMLTQDRWLFNEQMQKTCMLTKNPESQRSLWRGTEWCKPNPKQCAHGIQCSIPLLCTRQKSSNFNSFSFLETQTCLYLSHGNHFPFLTPLLSCLGLLLYGAHAAMTSSTLRHLEIVLRSHPGISLSYFLAFVWTKYSLL